jgi:hypothetical protein
MTVYRLYRRAKMIYDTYMENYFTDYLSDLDALSDGDLSCLLCDAADFDDDAAFATIVTEMKRRAM